MSLEQELLKAADDLEKTAAEMTNDASKEEPKTTDKKLTDEEDSLRELESNKGVTKAEAKEADKKEEEATDKVDSDAESEEKSEKVAQLKEELGISDQKLAEKVASADPSVVEYIKNLNQVPVESMGDEDSREKTASEDEQDAFEEFLSTPL